MTYIVYIHQLLNEYKKYILAYNDDTREVL